MTTFEWFGPTSGGHHSYRYNEDTDGLSRSIGVAGAMYDARSDCYRIHLGYHFTDLVPDNAYIREHKYPTLQAAKRAVERKVPPLIAVLKMQGVTI